jgi:hypothetical protein
MQDLINAFYSVMHKYEKFFSPLGVRANLERWAENKGDLTNLLRAHPNWNESEKAVIFEITIMRGIENDSVVKHRAALCELTVSELPEERRTRFRQAVIAATTDYSVTPSEHNIEVIKDRANIDCVVGQKSSRIIGKICKAFGVHKNSEYNKVFAQLSDALNPKEVRRKALLSVHPCDFLEMSSKSSSWTSCHGLKSGCHQAGCLSYLTDRDSMIFYTVDSKVEREFYKAPRRSRQMFYYHEGILLQSRLYPDCSNKEIIKQNRHMVQEAIACCLGVQNRWVLKSKKSNNMSDYYTTVDGSKQYADYVHDNTAFSFLKGYNVLPGNGLRIGSRPTCVCCGKVNEVRGGDIKCRCKDLTVCFECGQVVTSDSARYHEDKWLCNACLRICSRCDAESDLPLLVVFNIFGGAEQICADCYREATVPCQTCNIQNVCGTLSCDRLCPHITLRNAA